MSITFRFFRIVTARLLKFRNVRFFRNDIAGRQVQFERCLASMEIFPVKRSVSKFGQCPPHTTRGRISGFYVLCYCFYIQDKIFSNLEPVWKFGVCGPHTLRRVCQGFFNFFKKFFPHKKKKTGFPVFLIFWFS